MTRRGFVMIAVLVIVGAAILVATGAIFAARAISVGSRAANFEHRLRDAALDGVSIAGAMLSNDRARILAGASPATESLLLEIPDGDRRIEVRLAMQYNGESFASEAAKLDVNESDAATLTRATEDVSELARTLLANCASRKPIASIDAAAAFADAADSGDALREVLGPLRAIGAEREELDEGGTRSGSSKSSVPPLVELFTAHGAEPLVDLDGAPRLDLVAAFGGDGDGSLATASLDQFEDAERVALESVAKKAKDGADDGAIARALFAAGIESPRIDDLLASCTIQAGTHGVARLDIVRADVRVLAALDGIGADAAARIVDLRDSLDDTERKGTTWLVSRRVLSLEQFGAIAGRITNRSALWRFRVEARILAGGENAPDPASAPAAAEDSESRATYAFDCVVDLSTEPPRLAMLRDVSMLPTARALAKTAALLAAERDARAADAAPTEELDSPPSDDLTSESSSPATPTVSQRSPTFSPPTTPRVDLSAREPTIAPPIEPRAARGRLSPTGRDVGGGR